jgi:hypothetical protein
MEGHEEINKWVMLTVPGALVKEPKEEIFTLK